MRWGSHGNVYGLQSLELLGFEAATMLQASGRNKVHLSRIVALSPGSFHSVEDASFLAMKLMMSLCVNSARAASTEFPGATGSKAERTGVKRWNVNG